MMNEVIIDRENKTVRKNIKFDHPVNIKIQDLLTKHYGYKNPLVAREVEVLRLLEPYDIAPKVLEEDVSGFTMSFCGEFINDELWFSEQLPALGIDNVKGQVENILECLKKVGVIHRDIYSENIVIDDQGKIRLVDFGIADCSRIKGICDLDAEVSYYHAHIFCARHSDEVLRNLYNQQDFGAIKQSIENELLNTLPKAKGELGAHIHEDVIYHGLPFSDINHLFKHHRPFSDARINLVTKFLPFSCRTGIDLGCSVGANSFLLRQRGVKMTGVDHDLASINFAKKVNELKGYDIDFVHSDINCDFIRNLPPYDLTIWFSTWMWVAKLHGPILAQDMLRELSRKSRVLFFDTAQGGTDKANSYQLNGRDEVEKLLKENTVYKHIIDLGVSEGSYHLRNVFLCY